MNAFVIKKTRYIYIYIYTHTHIHIYIGTGSNENSSFITNVRIAESTTRVTFTMNNVVLF